MIEIFALYAVCALTFTISKMILCYAAPFTAIAVRMISAGLILAGYSCVRTYRTGTWSVSSLKKTIHADWPLLVQVLLFHIAIPYMAETWALTRITSIEDALMWNLSPFVAAFFSYRWFGEKLSVKKVTGIVIGFGAVLPLMFHYRQCSLETIFSLQLVPLMLVLCAVISSAYAWIVIRELVKNRGYTISSLNGLAMLGGGIISLACAGITKEIPSALPRTCAHWLIFAALTAAIILFANIIFYNGYGLLLKRYSATTLAFAGFSTPLFVSIFGFIFLGECFSWNYLVATGLVVIGFFVYGHTNEN